MKKPFLHSLTFHLVIIYLMINGLHVGCGNPFKKSANPPKIIDKQVIKIELEEPKDGNGHEKPRPKPSPTPPSKYVERDCGDLKWFGGIGITSESSGGQTSIAKVKIVHRGYPAEKYGIRPGDYILNWSEVRGDPGTEVTVKVLRGGEVIMIPIVRERICLEKSQ